MSHTDNAYATLLIHLRETLSVNELKAVEAIETKRALDCKRDKERTEFDVCEDCWTVADDEQGRWTEAGFECDECQSKEFEAARREFERSGGAAAYQREKLTSIQATDPVAFYIACKDHPETLDY